VRLAWLLLLPAPALAHEGGASVAWPTVPAGVGVVIDEGIELAWTDADRRFGTSTVTFDLRYSASWPPTAPAGLLPFRIDGRPIAVAVDELDPANRAHWDTRRVPAGSYMIWTLATEEPPDLPVRMVGIARGVVTVAHRGDPIHPAVIVGFDEPIRARGWVELPYEAFDPAGTASVSLEASRRFDGGERVLVARGLPALARGTHRWELAGVPPGAWAVRARISDARGLSFVAWSRFFLHVEPSIDAGAADRDALDAAVPEVSSLDAGDEDRGAAPPDPGAAADAGSTEDAAPAPPSSSCRLLDARAGLEMLGVLALARLGRGASRRRR